MTNMSASNISKNLLVPENIMTNMIKNLGTPELVELLTSDLWPEGNGQAYFIKELQNRKNPDKPIIKSLTQKDVLENYKSSPLMVFVTEDLLVKALHSLYRPVETQDYRYEINFDPPDNNFYYIDRILTAIENFSSSPSKKTGTYISECLSDYEFLASGKPRNSSNKKHHGPNNFLKKMGKTLKILDWDAFAEDAIKFAAFVTQHPFLSKDEKIKIEARNLIEKLPHRLEENKFISSKLKQEITNKLKEHLKRPPFKVDERVLNEKNHVSNFISEILHNTEQEAFFKAIENVQEFLNKYKGTEHEGLATELENELVTKAEKSINILSAEFAKNTKTSMTKELKDFCEKLRSNQTLSKIFFNKFSQHTDGMTLISETAKALEPN